MQYCVVDEGLTVFESLRLFPLQDGVNFGVGHGNAVTTDHMAEKFDFLDASCISEERLSGCVDKSFKDFPDYSVMLFLCFCIDQQIVQVNQQS